MLLTTFLDILVREIIEANLMESETFTQLNPLQKLKIMLIQKMIFMEK